MSYNQNKIILRSVYKVTRCFVEPALNPKTGRFHEIVRKIDSNGDMILNEDDRKSGKFLIPENNVVEIYDGKEFDLDDEYQTAEWDSIKWTKKIAQDRWERNEKGELLIDGNARRYGTAEFYVERPGLQSKQKNVKKRQVHEAKTYVYQDSPENLYQKVKLLGNSMIGLPISDVEDYLISLCEKNPSVILEIYTGTDTHLRLMLLDAIDKGVIYNRDKLFYFGDSIVLGASDSAVINYFKTPDNKRIVSLIKDEVYPEFAIKEVKTVDSLDLNSEEKANITKQANIAAQAAQSKKPGLVKK